MKKRALVVLCLFASTAIGCASSAEEGGVEIDGPTGSVAQALCAPTFTGDVHQGSPLASFVSPAGYESGCNGRFPVAFDTHHYGPYPKLRVDANSELDLDSATCGHTHMHFELYAESRTGMTLASAQTITGSYNARTGKCVLLLSWQTNINWSNPTARFELHASTQDLGNGTYYPVTSSLQLTN